VCYSSYEVDPTSLGRHFGRPKSRRVAELRELNEAIAESSRRSLPRTSRLRTMDSFASRSWRVEGINTTAEKHSNTGKFALVMKYRTSATHIGKCAPKKFRSSDPQYGCASMRAPTPPQACGLPNGALGQRSGTRRAIPLPHRRGLHRSRARVAP